MTLFLGIVLFLYFALGIVADIVIILQFFNKDEE